MQIRILGTFFRTDRLYPTATGAAVTHIRVAVAVVADGVHQSPLLGLAQNAQRLLPANSADSLAAVEGTLDP